MLVSLSSNRICVLETVCVTLFCREIAFLISHLQAFRFGCFDQLIDMYQRSNNLGQVWLKFFQQQSRKLFWIYFSNYAVCPLRPAFHCSFFSLLQCFPNIVFFSWSLWLFQQRQLTNKQGHSYQTDLGNVIMQHKTLYQW